VNFVPVSVVIPTFRDHDALKRALASVASQTLAPAQVIVVDDGGGDERIGDICGMSAIQTIELIQLPRNVGPGGARNAGIGVSNQAFVAFLDADDEWHPEKLQRQMAVMLGSEAPSFSAHPKGFSGLSWGDLNDQHPPKPIGRVWVLLSNPAPISTVIIRRDAIRHQFPLQYAGEDYAFVAENLLAGAEGVRLNQTLARAHKPAFGAGGLSGNLHAMQIGEMRVHSQMWRKGLIKAWEYMPLIPWSLMKYGRRLVVVMSRRLRRRLSLDSNGSL
jgi:glycosyltransferase involved in cell wall biosynthesis